MMDRRRYEFVLEAASPIAHHAEVFGNSALLMRRKLRSRDGGWLDVPVITADTMRHGMREAVSYAFLDAAGLLDSPSLSEAALRLLFAGGMVTGRGDAGAVKLEAYREMVDLVPSMSLFGGCAANRVIPGRLIVEDALLVCAESLAYVPDWVATEAGVVEGARSHIEEEQRVRMDPSLQPQKRLLLNESERTRIEGRLLASEQAHVEDDAIVREENKSTMLPRRFERLATGSRFSWAVQATCYSDLDVDTFHVALASFLREPRVGGKRATGHGLLRPLTARNIRLARPRESADTLDVGAMAPRVGELFRAHVAERASKIRTFLDHVDA